MRVDRRTFNRLVWSVAAAGTVATGGAAARHGERDGRTDDDPQGDGGRRGGARVRRRAETLVAIPGELTPENLALGPDGDLFFGITAGQVRRVDRETALTASDLSLDDTDLVATLPAVAGVESTPEGVLYVAVNAGEDTGVWTIPVDGDDPSQYVPFTPGVFVNDLVFDPDGDRLLVTESFSGVVYEVPVGPGGAPLEGVVATEWLASDLLDTPEFGANGLAFRGEEEVIVAVTRATSASGADVGRLVSVPVEDDGSAGDPETLLESAAVFGADGITVRDGSVWVAANGRNELVRVPPSGTPVVVADDADGLVFPSDVVFGETAGREGGSGSEGVGGPAFVCNFAVSDPDAAGILRLRP